MRHTLAYALTGSLVLVAAVGTAWPWLDAGGRRGLLAAAAVAWAVQVPAFGLLVGFRERTNRFLAAWVGGTLVRFALVGLAAWAVVELPALAPAPTLLGLAGAFFGLLLLEPLFFARGAHGTRTATTDTA